LQGRYNVLKKKHNHSDLKKALSSRLQSDLPKKIWCREGWFFPDLTAGSDGRVVDKSADFVRQPHSQVFNRGWQQFF